MSEEREPERPETADSVDPVDPDHDVWTGRAGVRPYGAVRRDPYAEESSWADPAAVEPSGRWWAPIAVGTVALSLLAAFAFGIAVIVQNTGGSVEQPAATPPTVRITTGRADPGITTPPAQQGEAPVTPATTDPVDAEVTVPALRGMPLADAQAALSRTGLGWRVIRRESDAEPDTVIACDPEEGQQVPSDTRINLVVATAPAGSSPTVVPSASSPG